MGFGDRTRAWAPMFPGPLAPPRRRRVLQGRAVGGVPSEGHRASAGRRQRPLLAAGHRGLRRPRRPPPAAHQSPPPRSMHYYVTMSIGDPAKPYFQGSPSLLDC